MARFRLYPRSIGPLKTCWITSYTTLCRKLFQGKRKKKLCREKKNQCGNKSKRGANFAHKNRRDDFILYKHDLEIIAYHSLIFSIVLYVSRMDLGIISHVYRCISFLLNFTSWIFVTVPPYVWACGAVWAHRSWGLVGI